MTKKDLENYRYLKKLIEVDERKLQHYKDNPPVAIHGKVQASSQCYPYVPVSVEVSGPDMEDYKAWKKKKDELIIKLYNERIQLEQLGIMIDEFFMGIEDARDRLVFDRCIVTGKQIGRAHV